MSDRKRLDVWAIVVTRGDVDLDPVMRSLRPKFARVEVWDNSSWVARGGRDLGPWGQFYAALQLGHEGPLYFQDDDVVVSDPLAIADAWRPGKIVCNMPAEFRPHYDSEPDKLMGFGSCFDGTLVQPTFERYLRVYSPEMMDQADRPDAVLWREPGRCFTGLNQERIIQVDVPKMDLPWASAPNRLWRSPRHGVMRDAMRDRVWDILEKERNHG